MSTHLVIETRCSVYLILFQYIIRTHLYDVSLNNQAEEYFSRIVSDSLMLLNDY